MTRPGARNARRLAVVGAAALALAVPAASPAAVPATPIPGTQAPAPSRRTSAPRSPPTD